MSAAPGVAVLKLDHYPLHAGTIGVARSAGRMGVDVHLLGEHPDAPAARSRYVGSTQARGCDAQSGGELVDWLCSAAPPGRPLLVPADDRGAVLVQRHAERLLGHYRFHRLPPRLAENLVDKAGMAALAREAGVPVPEHESPQTLPELESYLQGVDPPVVVKMRDPELARRTPGVPGVKIAETAGEVRDLWLAHLVDGRPNCILQEYIPGDADTVWMVNAYVDAGSSLCFAATARKLRQWPTYTGATSLGVCQHNDEVIELTRQLAQRIGYRGILDIGWRFDARDGQYKLLDFNPRLGATFRLFVGQRGLDVLRASYLDLAEQPVPRDTVVDGRTWLNDAYDPAAAAVYRADGNLTGREYLRSLRGVDELVWWATDDPKPALVTARTVLGAARVRLVSGGAQTLYRRRRRRQDAGP